MIDNIIPEGWHQWQAQTLPNFENTQTYIDDNHVGKKFDDQRWAEEVTKMISDIELGKCKIVFDSMPHYSIADSFEKLDELRRKRFFFFTIRKAVQ